MTYKLLVKNLDVSCHRLPQPFPHRLLQLLAMVSGPLSSNWMVSTIATPTELAPSGPQTAQIRKDADKGLSNQIWPCLPRSLGKASCFQQSAAGVAKRKEEETVKGVKVKLKPQVEDDSMVPSLLPRDIWRMGWLWPKALQRYLLKTRGQAGRAFSPVPFLLPFSHLPLQSPNSQEQDDIIFLPGRASLTNGLQAMLTHTS